MMKLSVSVDLHAMNKNILSDTFLTSLNSGLHWVPKLYSEHLFVNDWYKILRVVFDYIQHAVHYVFLNI